MSNTDTPRTDAEAYDSQPGNPMCLNGSFVVKADFARTLERELRELEFMAAQLATAKEQFRELQPLAEMMSRGFKPLGSWAELNAYILEKETALADALARVKSYEEAMVPVTVARYLWETSSLRHGMFTPRQFLDICTNRLTDYFNQVRAADRSAMATKEGAV